MRRRKALDVAAHGVVRRKPSHDRQGAHSRSGPARSAGCDHRALVIASHSSCDKPFSDRAGAAICVGAACQAALTAGLAARLAQSPRTQNGSVLRLDRTRHQACEAALVTDCLGSEAGARSADRASWRCDSRVVSQSGILAVGHGQPESSARGQVRAARCDSLTARRCDTVTGSRQFIFVISRI